MSNKTDVEGADGNLPMETERNFDIPYKSDEEIEESRQYHLKEWRKQEKKEEYPEGTFDPGSYGCHEAFHTAWVLMDSVGRHLVEHPAIVKDPVWFRLASKANDELFRLYQQMGAGHLSAKPDYEDTLAGIKKKQMKGRKKK